MTSKSLNNGTTLPLVITSSSVKLSRLAPTVSPDTFLNYVDFGIVSGNKERESVAIKLISMELNFADIQKATDLPILHLEQLANDNRDDL